jgi:heat shock protein HtpX
MRTTERRPRFFSNYLRTAVLMAVLIALLALVGRAVGGMGGMIFAVGFGLVMNFVMYWFSDRIALAAHRAQPVTPAEAPTLYRIVERLTQRAGLPMPRIYVIPSTAANAFATGRNPRHAAVAVTDGILQLLDERELEAVLAHELSHVKNYDVRLMTVVAALAGTILLLSDWSRRGLWWGGRSRNSDRGGGAAGAVFAVVWLVSIILAPIIAQIVSLAVSRQREYLADASGAELTRNPLGLASALQKIEDAVEPTPSIKQGIAHLCIADPRGRALNEREGLFANLFSTHPPIAKRIALLREMAYQKS